VENNCDLILSSRVGGVSKDTIWNSVDECSVSVFVYIIRCADGRYYTGTTRGSLEHRIAEHNAGTFAGYTASRRPVELVYSEEFDRIADAIAMERRIKGWGRVKKEALIDGDFVALKEHSKSYAKRRRSFDTRAPLAAQDEGE
jgi:putative endonuclease